MKINLEDLEALGFEIPSIIASGIATFIFVVISIYNEIKILLKYRNQQDKALFTVGLTWIFIIST
ncbi:MAG: hypothetical protein BAJALOKI2v1_800010 [Promethearchaeota archaeon]|nr:MAG: hypothetical protein BAJALOKI2v1_800010 [Candidatus Lokiarchaeota archaeon]